MLKTIDFSTKKNIAKLVFQFKKKSSLILSSLRQKQIYNQWVWCILHNNVMNTYCSVIAVFANPEYYEDYTTYITPHTSI